MKKVIIDYGKRTAVRVLAMGNNVHAKLTANAAFPDLPVTLVALAAQNTSVESAITAAADRGRMQLAALRMEKRALAGMLRQLADYVNTTVTDGDEAKLLSSGFDLYKTPETNQPPGAIARIEAVFTDISGTIDVNWKRASHARYYRVFISADNGQTWTLLETVFGRKLLAEQLVSGKRYQFKVIPVGISGTGPESDIASQIAA